MSTRSVTRVQSRWTEKEEEYKVHARIYRHWDGYPECHGKWLYDFLNGMVVVNGLTGAEPGKYANGPGRLAAQITAALAKDGHQPDLLNNDHDWLDFEYQVSVDYGISGGTITVEVFSGSICDGASPLFKGTVEEFGVWLNTYTDEDS